VLLYRAPHSYTCEDVVEIQGHGGAMAARRILRAVLHAGARQARPGEFTERAFLNGRIDLLQAEAVADLIRAGSERAATAALEQLEGRLSDVFGDVYAQLMAVAADLGASLDFDEGDLPELVLTGIRTRLEQARDSLTLLLATCREGRVLREGALVVIGGRPNVGKSTLFNRLLGSDRAIVTEVPGTTRDTIEEQLVLDGFPIRLVDTAGLREAECIVERHGVGRAEASLGRADLILYVVDGAAGLADEDRAWLSRADPARLILVANKQDLGQPPIAASVPGLLSVSCSAAQGTGLDSLRRTILDRLGLLPSSSAHASISERHHQLVQNALNDMNASLSLLQQERADAQVLAASHLRVAIESIGSVTGRSYTAELLDAIFSRFCVGK
jgi:tRNA modification GTPase